MTQTEIKARVDFAQAITARRAEERFQAIVRDALGLNETKESPEEHVARFYDMFRIGTVSETRLY